MNPTLPQLRPLSVCSSLMPGFARNEREKEKIPLTSPHTATKGERRTKRERKRHLVVTRVQKRKGGMLIGGSAFAAAADEARGQN